MGYIYYSFNNGGVEVHSKRLGELQVPLGTYVYCKYNLLPSNWVLVAPSPRGIPFFKRILEEEVPAEHRAYALLLGT